VIRPESPESDITATSRIRTSGSFRLIHIDEYGVTQDFAPVPDIFTSQGPCKRAKRAEKVVRQEPRFRRLNA
jgi:hypothetical protein